MPVSSLTNVVDCLCRIHLVTTSSADADLIRRKLQMSVNEF
jgi:hypothetical protein